MFIHILLINSCVSGSHRSDKPVILVGKTLGDLAYKFEQYSYANREKEVGLDDDIFEEEIQNIKNDILESSVSQYSELKIAEKLQYIKAEL